MGCYSRTRRISVLHSRYTSVKSNTLYALALLIGKTSILKTENLLTYWITHLNVGLKPSYYEKNSTQNCPYHGVYLTKHSVPFYSKSSFKFCFSHAKRHSSKLWLHFYDCDNAFAGKNWNRLVSTEPSMLDKIVPTRSVKQGPRRKCSSWRGSQPRWRLHRSRYL